MFLDTPVLQCHILYLNYYITLEVKVIYVRCLLSAIKIVLYLHVSFYFIQNSMFCRLFCCYIQAGYNCKHNFIFCELSINDLSNDIAQSFSFWFQQTFTKSLCFYFYTHNVHKQCHILLGYYGNKI